jgi:hypothetical protein
MARPSRIKFWNTNATSFRTVTGLAVGTVGPSSTATGLLYYAVGFSGYTVSIFMFIGGYRKTIVSLDALRKNTKSSG